MSALPQTTDTRALPAPVAGTPGNTALREAERLRLAWKADQLAALGNYKLHLPLLLLVAGAAATVIGSSPTVRLAGVLAGVLALALLWRGRAQHSVIVKPPSDIRTLRRQAATEAKVAQRLDKLTGHGWVVRHDVKPSNWPGAWNLDHVLIGPGGVVLVCAARDVLSPHDELAAANVGLDRQGVGPVHRVLIATGRTGGISHTWAGEDGSQGIPVTSLSRAVSWMQALPPVIPESQVQTLAARALTALGTDDATAVASPVPTLTPTPTSETGSQWDTLLATPTAPEPEAVPAPTIDLPRVQAALDKLDARAGLEHIAEQVRVFASRAMIDQERHAEGLQTVPFETHMIFAGESGTGKTTTAETWGEVLAALGRLPSGHVVKANRAKLVGKWEGHTTDMVAAIVEKALGGVLFIDEAYSLTERKANGGTDPFGSEAIELLLELMETHRDNLCVIAAGYEDEMARFLKSNPGLPSRFSKSRTIHFPTFSADQLIRIADQVTAENAYTLTPDARTMLHTRLSTVVQHPPKGWGNARTVRQILDESISAQAARLSTMSARTRDDLQRLTAQDVATALAKALSA